MSSSVGASSRIKVPSAAGEQTSSDRASTGLGRKPSLRPTDEHYPAEAFAETARRQWICYRCRSPLPEASYHDAFEAHKATCPALQASRPCRRCGEPLPFGTALTVKYHLACSPCRTRDHLRVATPLLMERVARPCRACDQPMPPELGEPIKYHPACSPWRAQMDHWANVNREEQRSWQKAKGALTRVTAYLADISRGAWR